MRLLIVEDEQKTGDYLKQGLSEAGFQVSLVRNGLKYAYKGPKGIFWQKWSKKWTIFGLKHFKTGDKKSVLILKQA